MKAELPIITLLKGFADTRKQLCPGMNLLTDSQLQQISTFILASRRASAKFKRQRGQRVGTLAATRNSQAACLKHPATLGHFESNNPDSLLLLQELGPFEGFAAKVAALRQVPPTSHKTKAR